MEGPRRPIMSETDKKTGAKPMTADLRSTIEDAFENRDAVNPETRGPVREAVVEALNLLDSGTARVAEKTAGGWVVNHWLKKAVLLGFRLNDMKPISGGPGGANWWDKAHGKYAGWDAEKFREAGWAVPNCTVAIRPTSRRVC